MSKKDQSLHFVIGDIHGCFDELVKLEKKIINFSENLGLKYQIISTGDLIDRGPKSNEVIEHFLTGESKGTHFSVMGNHEEQFLYYLKFEEREKIKSTRIKFPIFLYTEKERYKKDRFNKGITLKEYNIVAKTFWLAQGGMETLKSYKMSSPKKSKHFLPKKHLRYLVSRPLILEFPQFIVSHGLLTKSSYNEFKKKNGNKKSKEKLKNILWNRDINSIGSIKKKILISGHTPLKNVKRKRHSIQIDTKCYGGNKLSAYCPELDRVFSVKSIKKYY